MVQIIKHEAILANYYKQLKKYNETTKSNSTYYFLPWNKKEQGEQILLLANQEKGKD